MSLAKDGRYDSDGGLVMSAVHLLAFELRGRRFALPAPLVREVVRAVAVSALPPAPEIIEGVINVRGTLVPVVDVARRFGLEPEPLHPDQHLIVAQAGPRLVAARVDRAVDLMRVESGDIVPVAAVAPGAEHVAGLARLPDGVLVIQDLERFLSLDEGARVDAAVAAAAESR